MQLLMVSQALLYHLSAGTSSSTKQKQKQKIKIFFLFFFIFLVLPFFITNVKIIIKQYKKYPFN